LALVHCKIADDEVQEEVVELEPGSQEDEDCKSTAEARRYPIVSWLRGAELSDENRGPDPPCALENCEGPECAAGANTQGNVGAVEIRTEEVTAGYSNYTGEEGSECSGADGEPYCGNVSIAVSRLPE
jgi:hypothetical protein